MQAKGPRCECSVLGTSAYLFYIMAAPGPFVPKVVIKLNINILKQTENLNRIYLGGRQANSCPILQNNLAIKYLVEASVRFLKTGSDKSIVNPIQPSETLSLIDFSRRERSIN